MDNHSGRKCTSLQTLAPPTVVQHQPDIIPNVTSLTTEAPPSMLKLHINFSSSDEAYIDTAGWITAGHPEMLSKKTLKNPIEYLLDLAKLPKFGPV
jgi:hypothetical protein